MILEKIDERLSLWENYYKYVVEAKNYGVPKSFFDFVKPALLSHNNIWTFDQWLFNQQRYDLIDFSVYSAAITYGKIFMTSTLGDLEPNKLMDIWKNTGMMFMSHEKENEPWGMRHTDEIPWRDRPKVKGFYDADQLLHYWPLR